MPGKYLNSCHHKHLVAARYPIEITKVLNDPLMGLNNEDGPNNEHSDEENENIPIIPEEPIDISESVPVPVNQNVEAPISDYLHGKLTLEKRLKDAIFMVGKFPDKIPHPDVQNYITKLLESTESWPKPPNCDKYKRITKRRHVPIRKMMNELKESGKKRYKKKCHKQKKLDGDLDENAVEGINLEEIWIYGIQNADLDDPSDTEWIRVIGMTHEQLELYVPKALPEKEDQNTFYKALESAKTDWHCGRCNSFGTYKQMKSGYIYCENSKCEIWMHQDCTDPTNQKDIVKCRGCSDELDREPPEEENELESEPDSGGDSSDVGSDEGDKA